MKQVPSPKSKLLLYCARPRKAMRLSAPSVASTASPNTFAQWHPSGVRNMAALMLLSSNASVNWRRRAVTMSNSTYEHVLEEMLHLTPEERLRLRNALTKLEHIEGSPSSAAFVEFLRTAEPIRPEALDAMEWAID